MYTAAEGTPSLLDELFSRRARGIYDGLLARTGSRSLAADLCREAFLRVRQAPEGLDASELDALLTQAVEDAYLTYRDLSRLHDELFSPPGPTPPSLDTEAPPLVTEEVFSPPPIPDHPSPEPPLPPSPEPPEPETPSVQEPGTKPPSLLYDFQKEEVSSYFSTEPSVSMPPPQKGRRLLLRLIIPLLALFLLLFLWLLAGLLMSLGVIPFFDLGYLWFNSHIFRLF